MSKAIVTEAKLTAIANAVRDRFGVTGQKTLDELAEIIESHLPSNFQRVDYIQSGGGAYIITGNTTADGYDVEFSIDSGYTDDAVFGYRQQWNQLARIGMLYLNNSGYGLYAWGDNNTDINLNFPTTGEKHKFQAGAKYINAIFDDIELDSNVSTSVNGSKICIFNAWEAQESRAISGYDFHGKIYSLKLYYGQTLVNDFVPCYRKSDKVIGMYDVANSAFYTNSGNGTFTCYPAPPA